MPSAELREGLNCDFYDLRMGCEFSSEPGFAGLRDLQDCDF